MRNLVIIFALTIAVSLAVAPRVVACPSLNADEADEILFINAQPAEVVRPRFSRRPAKK